MIGLVEPGLELDDRSRFKVTLQPAVHNASSGSNAIDLEALIAYSKGEKQSAMSKEEVVRVDLCSSLHNTHQTCSWSLRWQPRLCCERLLP